MSFDKVNNTRYNIIESRLSRENLSLYYIRYTKCPHALLIRNISLLFFVRNWPSLRTRVDTARPSEPEHPGPVKLEASLPSIAACETLSLCPDIASVYRFTIAIASCDRLL